MKKRFLLNRIALDAADVSPRHIQSAAAVVAHLADAGLSFWDGAAMPAGITADATAVEFFVKVALTYLPVNDFVEGCHRGEPLTLF